jgi:hypothetical protein
MRLAKRDSKLKRVLTSHGPAGLGKNFASRVVEDRIHVPRSRPAQQNENAQLDQPTMFSKHRELLVRRWREFFFAECAGPNSL